MEIDARPRIIGTALLAALFVVGAVYFYVNSQIPPRHTVQEWTPEPYDPPVRWAHRSLLENCHTEDPPATDEMVVCTEWTLRADFTKGEGELDPGFAYGAGCGGYDGSDDDCSAQLQLFDAASRVRTGSAGLRDMPVAVSRDGHRVAYFSKRHSRFVGWDLRAARLVPISPRLDRQGLEQLRDLDISPDGHFFAVAFAGADPHVLLTDFDTGRTATVPGFCRVHGMSRKAARMVVERACDEKSSKREVTLVDRDGSTLGNWTAVVPAHISPDGRTVVTIRAGDGGKIYVVKHDAATGEVVRKRKLALPPDAGGATGYGWLHTGEYAVRVENPETGDFHGYYRVVPDSERSTKIQDLYEDSTVLVALGSV